MSAAQYFLRMAKRPGKGTGEIIIPPPEENDPLEKLVVHYNNTNFVYNPSYPGKNIIQVATVCPNYVTGTPSTLAANTGLAYDLAGNRLFVICTPNGEPDHWRDRQLGFLADVPGLIANQGAAYNSVTGEFYALNAANIQVKNAAGTVLKTLTFSSTQPAPGMVFFHQHTQRFYCSYDAGDSIRIWTPDFTANTLTLFSQIFGLGAEEGCGVSYIDGSIWFNKNSAKVNINHAGTVLQSFAWSGGGPGSGVGAAEGLVVDPTDDTLWFNSDEFYHGGVNGGNQCWHLDPKTIYDKYLRFPHQIHWSKGKLNGLTITGIFGESKLVGTGDWESPIIKFTGRTMQQIIGNYSKTGDGNLTFRGSNTAPTTTISTEFPIHYYDANQLNVGWGDTVPGLYSSSPMNTEYGQIKISK